MPSGLSSVIASALYLGDDPQRWKELARDKSRSEVEARLRQADLGGLVQAVWSSIEELNAQEARPVTPTLPESRTPGEAASTPTMARQPSYEPAPDPLLRAARFVPHVEIMQGRVPRSEETWQYHEGENSVMGCCRAVRVAQPRHTSSSSSSSSSSSARVCRRESALFRLLCAIFILSACYAECAPQFRLVLYNLSGTLIMFDEFARRVHRTA